MFKGRKFGVLATALVLIAIGSFYSNCSKSLPPELTDSSSKTTSNQLSALNAQVVPSFIDTTQTAQIVATGGLPPYTYSVSGGSPTISGDGAISGPLTAGVLILTITDSAQQTVQTSLSISDPTATTTGQPCTTPWGSTIASGQSIVAFQAATLICPTPNTCQPETRTCTNGVLSGSATAQSCAKQACVYKETAYAGDPSSGASLCQGATSSGSIPASCPDSAYHISKYCRTSSVNGGGDTGPITTYYLFVCSGPNEKITPQPYSVFNSGGGAGDMNGGR